MAGKVITVNGNKYTFISDYKDNDRLRESFNTLANLTWEFTFEEWYKSGYWDNSCHLYSLMDGDKMVSHITISVFESVILAKEQTLVQLGTVMTDRNYRKQGLNKVLMDIVLEEWESKCDMMYLFANDSVLDYYPKFGFSPVNEYSALKSGKSGGEAYSIRKMNIDTKKDFTLLDRLSRLAVPLFDLSVIDNVGLVMFYCHSLGAFKDNLYFLEDLDTIVIAEYQEQTIIVHDIFASQSINLDLVLNSLMTDKINNVEMHFIPQNKGNYEINPYKDDSLTLFVSSKDKKLFEENKLIFPTLTHT